MADHDAALKKPVVSQTVRARLAQHLPDRIQRDGRIVRRQRQLSPQRFVRIFEIRQIDLHEAFQFLQRLGAFIAGAVPDDGDRKRQVFQDAGDLPGKMTGRNEADIVNALLQKSFDDPDQLIAVRRKAGDLAAGDGMILTVDAGQMTARKKERAAAAGPAQARFLPEVRGGADQLRDGRRSAEAVSFLRIAYGSAGARTETADKSVFI